MMMKKLIVKMVTILVLCTGMIVQSETIIDKLQGAKDYIVKYEGDDKELVIRNKMIEILKENPQVVVQLVYTLLNEDIGFEDRIILIAVAVVPQYGEEILKVVNNKEVISDKRLKKVIKKYEDTKNISMLYLLKKYTDRYTSSVKLEAIRGGIISQKTIGISNNFPTKGVVQFLGGTNSFDPRRYNE